VRDETLTPSLVIARGGGGGHGGGGHSGGGGGGGFGGHSGGGMHAGTGFYPGAVGGGPMSITTIVLVLAIVFLCFLIARWAINTFISAPSLPGPQEDFAAPAPFAAPPAATGTADLAAALSGLRTADPDFELETFLQRAEMTFYLVKSAFEKGDAAAGRAYLSPALFAGWSGEIATLHGAGKRVLFESLNVRGLQLVSAQHDASGDALAQPD
jgi:predicted lipid-binding transport protein (Tim44 family)